MREIRTDAFGERFPEKDEKVRVGMEKNGNSTPAMAEAGLSKIHAMPVPRSGHFAATRVRFIVLIIPNVRFTCSIGP